MELHENFPLLCCHSHVNYSRRSELGQLWLEAAPWALKEYGGVLKGLGAVRIEGINCLKSWSLAQCKEATPHSTVKWLDRDVKVDEG